MRLKEKLFSVPVTMPQYTYVMILDVATGKRRVQPVRFPIPGQFDRYLKYRITKCEGELPASFKEDPQSSTSGQKQVVRVAPYIYAPIRPEMVTFELSDWESSEDGDPAEMWENWGNN